MTRDAFPGAAARRPFRSALGRGARATLANLCLGARLVFLRPVEEARGSYCVDQILILALIAVFCGFSMSLLLALPEPRFNPWAVLVDWTLLLNLLLAGYLFARFISRGDHAVRFVVKLLAVSVVLTLLYGSIFWGMFHGPFRGDDLAVWYPAIYWGFLAWGLMAAAYAIYVAGGRRIMQAAGGGLPLYALLVVAPSVWLSDGTGQYWYPAPQASEAPPGSRAYRELDVEAIYYGQPRKLEQLTSDLLPQRPGVTDLYFVGFAGFAHQDVFLKEVTYIRELFDRRFDTRGRSAVLVNNLQTIDETPLAITSNLAGVLRAVAARMDPEEDVLFLYLTSHGSPDFTLSVDFWPMPLKDLSAAALRSMLDEAGIKWRIVVVSACFSGGFIDTLRDGNTFIATAAARDRRSFGCSNEREFTYFGKALFNDALTRTWSFAGAFEAAADIVAAQERAEGLEPSRPQRFIGEAMARKLRELETRLASAGSG